MEPELVRTSVLVVGGGPIGLALAAGLGKRGVECTLVEQRDDAVGTAKMIVVGVRTMELCRQLGIADTVRNWGFPLDHALDSVFCTSLNGFELGRVKSPPLSTVADTPHSPERERPCPQTWFDPILRDFARTLPSVRLEYRTRLVSLSQDEEAVSAVVEDEGGRRRMIVADYLVGCDGFSSTVRALLGIEIRGQKHLDRSTSIYVRSSELRTVHGLGDAYRFVFVEPAGPWAVLTTMDGRDLWRIQLIGHGSADLSRDQVGEVLERMAGTPVEFHFEDVSSWIRKMTVADRFSDGRVFLAGDAAHAHPPNGGLGMNTGMQDAFDLAWKLAALLQGWGGPSLVDSYDMERRPASARAAEESLANYYRLTKYPLEEDLSRADEKGENARARLGRLLVEENEKAWQSVGVHLGYCYWPSPIVVADGSPKPDDDLTDYTPSAFPGRRAPHAWLADGRSILDLFGHGFVLLNFSKADIAPLVDAARRRGVPLAVHAIEDEKAAGLYERKLVLVRPDGHVATNAPPTAI
jgi:2-polyprenyl-6-methoxyphenol hydroxylase-like FAD-dependent oxidoreductase